MLIWKPWSQKDAVLLSPDKPSVAVMYFKNNTGNENFNFWSSALSDSIITDLSQSKFIRVLNSSDLYSILKSHSLLEAKSYAAEDLKNVAIEGRVNHVLQGGLSKAGEIFRIEYTLHEMNTGQTLSSARVEGKGEESIFSMVDELTKKIKASLELSEKQIASDLDEDVGKITTNSPEAYRHFSKGRESYFKGDREKAIEQYKKAISIDPEFAYAYLLLGNSYRNMGYRSFK